MKSGRYLVYVLLIIFVVSACSEKTTEPPYGWEGSGTQNDPYLIESAYHLKALADSVNTGITYEEQHFVLTSDISLAEYQTSSGWMPIGKTIPGLSTAYFMGNFDGDGHKITGLYINRQQGYQGLFGSAKEATIKNLYIENAQINSHADTGILAAVAFKSEIINCATTGTINGGNNVGGLISLIKESTVDKCFSNVEITGNGYLGGMFSGISASSQVSNSYSGGSITGEAYIGGFAVAAISSSITNCYSYTEINGENHLGGFLGTIAVSQDKNNYWDIEITDLTESAGGIARTTNEMTYPYAENTYEEWDFENIWVEDENYEINDGYPYLIWQR